MIRQQEDKSNHNGRNMACVDVYFFYFVYFWFLLSYFWGWEDWGAERSNEGLPISLGSFESRFSFSSIAPLLLII